MNFNSLFSSVFNALATSTRPIASDREKGIVAYAEMAHGNEPKTYKQIANDALEGIESAKALVAEDPIGAFYRSFGFVLGLQMRLANDESDQAKVIIEAANRALDKITKNTKVIPKPEYITSSLDQLKEEFVSFSRS